MEAPGKLLIVKSDYERRTMRASSTDATAHCVPNHDGKPAAGQGTGVSSSYAVFAVCRAYSRWASPSMHPRKDVCLVDYTVNAKTLLWGWWNYFLHKHACTVVFPGGRSTRVMNVVRAYRTTLALQAQFTLHASQQINGDIVASWDLDLWEFGGAWKVAQTSAWFIWRNSESPNEELSWSLH